MARTSAKLPLLPFLAILAGVLCAGDARAFWKQGSRSLGQRSVVKVYVTQQREDYALPWQGRRPVKGTGTGFIIDGRRILSNAHVVSDARFVELQKDGDPRRYRAKVAFIAHDCDLAILAVEDAGFFDGTRPLRFAAELPGLDDQVTVIGYPRGGARLSVTRGIVSRIDYSVYSHSAVDEHLVLQVDAAINPGNSGGPVLQGRHVVGLAFQGLAWADNIGYAIPVPVIRRFLQDVADGAYDGYSELGVSFLPTRNRALKQHLQVPDGTTGVAVHWVDPFGSARDLLQPGDVLTSIDGHNIADDGNVRLDGTSILFAELLERKQRDDVIKLGILREGALLSITVPLRNLHDPFVYRNLYDERPRYVVRSGLVFAPLTREYLRTVDLSGGDANASQLLYHLRYAKPDGLYTNAEEFVILTRRLPHEVNTYADPFLNGVVQQINERPIRSLADVLPALEEPRDGFHVFSFAGMDDQLVLKAADADAAHPAILERYGVSPARNLGDMP